MSPAGVLKATHEGTRGAALLQAGPYWKRAAAV